jgi:hypothetical protein
MDKRIKKFLQFNGKNIYFLSRDGEYWVALKPICDALGANWNRQFQSLKEDEFLKAAFAVQQMQVDGIQTRSYLALPEKYVYGWILSINTDNADLKLYKWKCYELLFNYFNGVITKRLSELRVKSEAEILLEEAEKELKQTEQFKNVLALKENIKKSNINLVKLDDELNSNQLNMFFSNN